MSEDANPCFARALRNCAGGPSREHYLSEGILRALDDGGGVRIAGLPFLEGRTDRLPPKALTAKVLCEKHNSELSPLDAEALKLFHEIDAIDALANKTGVQGPTTLSGNLIERWLLKFMLGASAAGFARSREGAPVHLEVPEKLVRICFGLQSHDRFTGLYIDGAVGERVTRSSVGVTAQVMLNPDHTLANVHVDMNRLHLVHHLDGAKPTPSLNHRPRELRFVHEVSGATKSLFFTWQSSHGGNRWVQMVVHGRPST